MTKCKCGCGEEVKDGKTWVNGGHAAKWKKSNLNKINEKYVNALSEPSIFYKLTHMFSKKSTSEIKEVESPEDLIVGLRPYEIPDHNPKSGLGKLTKKDKDYIQVVLVSELIEPKTFWAEKTGMNRIQYKDRMFKLPRDIKGNVFFWHIDKKEPLVDSAHANQSDAETSFHELQLFNMAYSVGRAAGANDLMSNLKLILLIVGFSMLLSVAVLIYLNMVEKGLHNDNVIIMNTLNYINQTRPP